MNPEMEQMIKQLYPIDELIIQHTMYPHEAYWHRKHQIRNMYICPKHGCMLIDSGITAKSEQTFILFPAETSVKDAEIKYVGNPHEIAYIEYLSDVFDAHIDFENDTPISAVLYHFMSRTKYLKSSGKTRYTKQLADDIKVFYKGHC